MFSKKIIRWVGVIALFSGVALSVARAERLSDPQFSCDDETWSSPLNFDRDGMLKGTITSLCYAPESKRQGFISLSEMLLNETVRNAYQVHNGPVRGPYLGMPAVRYDLTTRYENGKDPLFIRSDFFVATDEVNRLVYANLSKKVNSSGMAKYLKKVDLLIESVPAGKGGYYYRISASVAAERPFYAPEGTFKNEAEKMMRKQYRDSRAQWAPAIADSL